MSPKQHIDYSDYIQKYTRHGFKEVSTTQREPSDSLTLSTCIVQLLVSLVSRYISTLHNYARLCLSFKILLHANVQPVVNYCTCDDSFSWRKYEKSIKTYQLIFITFRSQKELVY